MRKAFFALLAPLALTACDDKAPYQTELERAGHATAVKVLTSEDGVTLWAYDPPNESTVYFTTTSAVQSINCGKGCQRSALVTNVPVDTQPLRGRVLSSTTNPDGSVTVTIQP